MRVSFRSRLGNIVGARRDGLCMWNGGSGIVRFVLSRPVPWLLVVVVWWTVLKVEVFEGRETDIWWKVTVCH
jgi:hypothetical protein